MFHTRGVNVMTRKPIPLIERKTFTNSSVQIISRHDEAQHEIINSSLSLSHWGWKNSITFDHKSMKQSFLYTPNSLKFTTTRWRSLHFKRNFICALIKINIQLKCHGLVYFVINEHSKCSTVRICRCVKPFNSFLMLHGTELRPDLKTTSINQADKRSDKHTKGSNKT